MRVTYSGDRSVVSNSITVSADPTRQRTSTSSPAICAAAAVRERTADSVRIETKVDNADEDLKLTAALAPRVRTAVLLRYQQGLSYPEIARLSNEKAPALQVRVARALPLLRRCLEAGVRFEADLAHVTDRAGLEVVVRPLRPR